MFLSFFSTSLCFKYQFYPFLTIDNSDIKLSINIKMYLQMNNKLFRKTFSFLSITYIFFSESTPFQTWARMFVTIHFLDLTPQVFWNLNHWTANRKPHLRKSKYQQKVTSGEQCSCLCFFTGSTERRNKHRHIAYSAAINTAAIENEAVMLLTKVGTKMNRSGAFRRNNFFFS